MAKKELMIEVCPEVRAGSPFVLYFQTQAVLLLRTRGLLTETQAEKALRLLKRSSE